MKLPRLLAAIFIALSANLFILSTARAEDVATPEVTTIVTRGGDDVSYRIPLTVSIVYDGVTYENVYATTNSVITFGRADGTYWDYPVTPSISIESKDWWVLPQQMPDTHFILNVSDGGFQVDGAYRPYGTMTGDVTSIIITAQIQTDGTVAYTYAVDGPLSGNERTGAVLTDGTVVSLAEVNIIEVEEAPVLEPTPVEPEPVVPEPEPEPEPEPTPEPVPEAPVVLPPAPPVIDLPIFIEPPVVIEPELPSEPEPEPEPEVVPVEPEPTPNQEPLPVEEVPVVVETEEESSPIETPIVEPVVDESVTLDNGVVLTQEQALAVSLLQDPIALLQELFTNPGAVLAALSHVGSDMSPEVREESEKILLSAIIASGIATQAAASAAYRRKP